MSTVNRLLPKTDVQGVLALAMTAAIVYMSIIGTMPSEILAGLAGVAIGYYFSSKENDKDRTHLEKLAWDAQFLERSIDRG